MSELIALQVVIPTEDIAKLLNKLKAITRASVIKKSLFQGGQYINGWIRDKRLSGPRPQYLGVKTGRLRSSIATSKPEQSGNMFFVKIGTNIKYAPIHEFGGVINRKASVKALFFKKFKGGRQLFSKEKKATFGRKVSVGAYTITMPARPFLRPGIVDKENQQWVLDNLKENIEKSISEAK